MLGMTLSLQKTMVATKVGAIHLEVGMEAHMVWRSHQWSIHPRFHHPQKRQAVVRAGLLQSLQTCQSAVAAQAILPCQVGAGGQTHQLHLVMAAAAAAHIWMVRGSSTSCLTIRGFSSSTITRTASAHIVHVTDFAA